MTTRADGSVFCDRCGASVGNGSVTRCAVISVVIEGGDRVVNLHLCNFNGRIPGAGGPPAERCVTRVLTLAALRNYFEAEQGAPLFVSEPVVEEPAVVDESPVNGADEPA